MGLFSFVSAPVRGVMRLGELIQRQAEQDMHDPAAIRRELEEIDDRRASGELSAREEAEAQQQVLDRMAARPQTPETKER
ncbi:MAG TPA: gas vesicle protein GvpG [Actinophytocola sp.]|uniref:gas vesicle protein GvpG n=1 Tax=Actinophytocola sp. TaxID=1872138 RepID=UPI002F933F0C